MDDVDYNPEEALRTLLEWHWERYASREERSHFNLACRLNRTADPKRAGSFFLRRAQAEWEQADEPTRRAVAEGPDWIRTRAIERLVHAFLESGITGRCPQCQGILRTPLAKQCRWCFHDWHDT